MDKHIDHEKQQVKDREKYRGADINAADDDKVSDPLVKQDIKLRNSNPHSQGL